MAYCQNKIKKTDAKINIIGNHNVYQVSWSLFSNDIILINLSDYEYKLIKYII